MQSKLIEVTTSQQLDVTTDTQYVLLINEYIDDSEKIIELNFKKQGVTAEIVLIYNVPVKGKLNVSTIAHHFATNTSCLTKVKGILNDKSSSNYIGKILIEKSAQQTSSFLRDDVLVVGEGIRNESQPILMIDADDVKASHGATTGRINDEEVYYLQARGFDRDEAQNLIVDGFLRSLVDQILDDKIRDVVAKKLNLEKTENDL